MDFDDDSFCVNFNNYTFYFLHGSQTSNSLQLHGKLKNQDKFHPCTLVLSPVTKCIYVKVKTKADIQQIKEQVEDCLKLSIKGITTYSSEVVLMQTIYSHNIEQFLKIQYKLPEHFYFDNNTIPKDSCIDYIYGLKDNVLDAYLLEKGIKGPCWLQIETYSNDVAISCPSTLNCHPNDVTIMPMNLIPDEWPSLNIIILDVANIPVANDKLEPFAIAVGFGEWNGKLCTQKSTKVLAVIDTTNKTLKNVVKCNDRIDIIKKLHKLLNENDTNIIICHDKQRFIHHSNVYAVTLRNIFAHHIVMDLKQIAEELYPHLLNEDEHLFEYFLNDADKLPAIHSQHLNTADITKLMCDRIHKYFQLVNEMDIISTYTLISNVTGCPLNIVSSCGQLKRVDYMLKQHLHKESMLMPEKCNLARCSKDVIQGGKFIEPKIGFFTDLIIGFDFKSLYPSVIQEYNLSFTRGDNMLPNLMQELLRMRERLALKERNEMPKKCIANSTIVKLLTNSVYGCLCSEYSVFYHPQLAGSITKHGRDVLTALEADMPSALQCTIIFGQTDSLFVELFNTNDYEVALIRALKYQEMVNKSYQHVRLKLEGVFSHGVIFGKQQYALRYHNSYPRRDENWIVKGILRKTTPRICQDLFRYFLERIVIKQPRFARTNEFLSAIQTKFTSDDVNDYVVHVQLQNAPETYSAHTAYGNIVRRRNLKGCHRYRQHDNVSYVICLDGTGNDAHSRAYDLEEFNTLRLRVDKDYYKERQVLTLLEKILTAVPQYVNVDSVHAFLKPQWVNKSCMLNDCATTLPTHYKHDNVLPFHFRCLKCMRHVVLNQRLHYEYFVTCRHCKALFMSDVQADEICATVENTIDEYSEKLAQLRKLSLAKGSASVSKMAVDCLACLEMQFFKQMALWKEIIWSAWFSLEWFSGDKVSMEGCVRKGLVKLFERIILLLDSCLERSQRDYGIVLFDFRKFYSESC